MERWEITIEGIVQGVGFRPFVHRLASQLGLVGFVNNHGGAVVIEAEGDSDELKTLLRELQLRTPPLARIDSIASRPLPPKRSLDFRIEESHAEALSAVFVPSDAAVCPECVSELFDPCDRRYRYPFLNCTNCGPRLTIIVGAPYDRERTTMAHFAMCIRCQAEYDDPADRRFHAQPTACPACGPRLELRSAAGERMPSSDPLADFAAALLEGRIGALKGLGGYYLACDARRDDAVSELRRRKHREEKPFAVMAPDLAAAATLCEVSPRERELLLSPAAPIVLLRRRGAGDAAVAASVAPGNPYLGVMLPYTPLHHLLVEAVRGAPLVMTSGNCSDEPIAYEDGDALERLAGIADVFLVHNRPIQVRCDDSVTRVVAGAESPIRRSRGFAPQSIRLPAPCPQPLLAVGGQLKSTFALARDDQAILSHHLGDLDHYEAACAFERAIALYQELFAIRPACIVHDLHPDYASTRFALAQGLPCVAVQHHHAHLAACMAEHGLTEPVIGVVFDGSGLGTDGAIWGGEFLIGDYGSFVRAAHLRYVAMPGGEQAVREPWRMAVSHLRDAGCDSTWLTKPLSPAGLRTVETMIERRFNAPLTSSMGRLFDAVAAIAQVRSRVSYEGQAAIELEWLASDVDQDVPYSFEICEAAAEGGDSIGSLPAAIDTRPLIRAVAADARRGVESKIIARRFHSTIVELIVEVCRRIHTHTDLSDVVLSGGVFMNSLLAVEATARLSQNDFRVFRHELTPPNDGSLSLGQVAVASRILASQPNSKGKTACALEFPDELSKRATNTTC